MNFLNAVITFICGSWQVIYLYGLSADSSVKYNPVLIIFPVLTFLLMFLLIYLEYKRIEKNK